jgi:hypothetical protein
VLNIVSKRTLAGCSASLIACLFTLSDTLPASAATPTVFATCAQLFEVNGLAATQDKLLFTTQNQPNMYQVDSSGANCTLFAVVPPPANKLTAVVEEYIAISPGLGGFPAGWIYVTQYEKVFKISPDGTSVSLFATIPDFSNHLVFHSGITFDQSGNYGNKMIVTGQAVDGHGEVFTIDSSGTPTKLTDLGGDGNTGITEGPQVALASFTPAPGKLLVTQEELNMVWIINPDGTKSLLNTLGDISGTNVIPNNLCTLVPSNGTFFTTDWANGRILKYSPADVTSGSGVLLPVENTFPGTSVYFESNSGAVSVFDSSPVVAGGASIIHEASTFVTCNASTVCPLTPGYWKNHAFPTTMTFPVVIGGISYSKADFVTVLNNPGGGNAVTILAYQLVAALLNISNGATVPGNVAATIADAESLLNGINMTSGFVPPSSTLGQKMIADAAVISAYNFSCNL